MENILNIINTLKNRDIKIIERYIQNVNNSEKKLKLFRLILNDKQIDENKASLIIYNKNTNNINKLKERLLSDIEDVMLLRLNKNSSDNVYYRNESKTLILLLHAHYYLKSGLLDEADKKLRKIKRLIREHNFVFLTSLYHKLSCEYLERICSTDLEYELNDSIKNLSELLYIQKLNISKQRFESNKINSNPNSGLNKGSEFGLYSSCLDKLTQLKYFVCEKELVKAEQLYESLHLEATLNMSQVPLRLYVEILLQKIKINILKKSFLENKPLLVDIKSLCFNSENLYNDFLKLRFVNSFLLQDYDLCKNIIFYFFSDKNINSSNTLEIINQWKYFDICLTFIKKEYRSVLNLINKFPLQSSVSPNVLINVKILEFYSLMLLDEDDLVLNKYDSIGGLLKKLNFRCKDRYEYLLERIKKLSEFRLGDIIFDKVENELKSSKNGNVPDQDILGLELIPFEFVEDAISYEHKNYQYTE